MAKEYKVGEKYYLPVTVERIVEGEFGVTLSYADGDEGDTALIWNAPDLLLTAEDIIAKSGLVGKSTYDEYTEKAERRIRELEAECEKWKATAQICEDNAKVADMAANELRAENDKLREVVADRTKDVQHLTAENIKMEAERDDLKSQVGSNLADIQNLTSDVHFLKEKCNKQKAEYDELKGRYDELDSVNHEQAEKIRDLDKTVAKLKDENTNLSFLLEAQPEEEAKKPVHVFTNDGTEVEFRRYTSVQYRTDYNILVIKDGEEIVAGFIRGDRPGNLAFWWTE